VGLDRDLHLLDTWQEKAFHLDRYEYQGSANSSLVNLARLMSDNPHAKKLRQLIIDKYGPSTYIFNSKKCQQEVIVFF